jgi:S-formylglutathione hydrolase FrmB
MCNYDPMFLCGEKKRGANWILVALILVCLNSRSAVVDTVNIYSNAMHKDLKCVVIRPSDKKLKHNTLPVIYLLHGYGGWYSNWIIRAPELKNYADDYKLIIVCPEGGNSSWYFDSPIDTTMRYETFVATEVPDYIDSHYNTIKDRKGRAITGLSMGGHGSLFLAFRHADRFGACGSMSGVMDLYNSRNKYDIMKRIGDTITNATNWKNYSVLNLVELYPKDSLAITFDCGLSDPFSKDNRLLHEKMLQLKIPHDYTERPGKHEWPYWRNSIEYHLLFFRNYFDKRLSK